MSAFDTLCKGNWEAVDQETEESFIRECPHKKTCLRFVARHSISMIPFYEVVPIRRIMESDLTNDNPVCDQYIKWSR